VGAAWGGTGAGDEKGIEIIRKESSTVHQPEKDLALLALKREKAKPRTKRANKGTFCRELSSPVSTPGKWGEGLGGG